jgi:biliverdin reductase
MPIALSSLPLRVGLVGTGYAAKLRAESLQADPRTQLVAIAGHSPAKTAAFCQTYAAASSPDWSTLLTSFDLDMVVIAGVNRDHGAIAQAALTAGKHVVVEYPLCLDVTTADALIALAQAQQRLLHVEHIELLGGVHQALKAHLAEVGFAFYARYATIKAEHPAPQKWTYHPELFGFPLMGALSRLHRFIDLFGPVATVSCQTHFHAEPDSPYYRACLCTAQLRFHSGVLAEVVYGKGDRFWRSHRLLEVQGDQGALLFDGEQGTLIQAHGSSPILVNGRRGLFAKDTAMVVDHLTLGTPLYLTSAASVYTLKVADAARRSALTGAVVAIADGSNGNTAEQASEHLDPGGA